MQDRIKGSTITFDNVHFAYEAERPILQGVSLTVQPKQTVAIVGETGCGKTTIGKLLLKIIEPDQGVIRFGSNELSQLQRHAVRDAIGVVPKIPSSLTIHSATTSDMEISTPAMTKCVTHLRQPA